ncbi:MAG: hypothetical protein H0W06_00300 [Chloroflexia bacterium]|nr:hypothetical protein [Chloroflexia bacterium]
MPFIRLIGRGLSDTLEQLLPFTLLTLAWWLCALLIVPLGPATIALFASTDPRRLSVSFEWEETVAIARRSWRRGWLILLATMPPILVLLWNLHAYGIGQSRLVVLVPLWTTLLPLFVGLAIVALAVAALLDLAAGPALRHATTLVLRRPLRALLLVVLLGLLFALGAVLVVPLFMFVPAMAAAIVNRVVLDHLGIAVADPLAPTDERQHEERTEGAA